MSEPEQRCLWCGAPEGEKVSPYSSARRWHYLPDTEPQVGPFCTSQHALAHRDTPAEDVARLETMRDRYQHDLTAERNGPFPTARYGDYLRHLYTHHYIGALDDAALSTATRRENE